MIVIRHFSFYDLLNVKSLNTFLVLLQKVAEMVGFDYDIHLVYDGKYGTKQADGSWNGMIGELLSGVSCPQLKNFSK